MLVSPIFKNAVKNGDPFAILVDVDHPSGPGYFWDGTGDLEFEGKTYKGAGLVGFISSTKKSAELRIDEVRFYIAMLDPAEVEQLDDDVINRIATIRVAALNEARRVVDVYVAEEVLLDYQVDKIDENRTSSLEIIGQGGLWMLERSTDAAYSQEEARLKYPNETGFTGIPGLKNKDTSWTKEEPD